MVSISCKVPACTKNHFPHSAVRNKSIPYLCMCDGVIFGNLDKMAVLIESTGDLVTGS